MKNVLGLEGALSAVVQGNLQGGGAGEAGLTHQQVEIGGGGDPAFAAFAKAGDDVPFTLAHDPKVDADVAGGDAVVGGAAGEIGDPGTGDHGLGGGAAFVDTGATDVAAFDEGGAATGIGEGGRQRTAGLATADDDCVVVFLRHDDSFDRLRMERWLVVGPAHRRVEIASMTDPRGEDTGQVAGH